MASVFAEDFYDNTRQTKKDEGGNLNPQRHHPDAPLRSSFPVPNGYATGMEEKASAKPAPRAARKAR